MYQEHWQNEIDLLKARIESLNQLLAVTADLVDDNADMIEAVNNDFCNFKSLAQLKFSRIADLWGKRA